MCSDGEIILQLVHNYWHSLHGDQTHCPEGFHRYIIKRPSSWVTWISFLLDGVVKLHQSLLWLTDNKTLDPQADIIRCPYWWMWQKCEWTGSFVPYLVKELLLCVDEHWHFFSRPLRWDALLGFPACFADHQTIVTFTTGFIGPLGFRHLLTVQTINEH